MTGRVSSGSRRAAGLFLPTEIRKDVGASLAANLAGEQRLEIGQADVIRLRFCAVAVSSTRKLI